MNRRIVIFAVLFAAFLGWSFFLFKRHPSVWAHHRKHEIIAERWQEARYDPIHRSGDFYKKVRNMKLLTNCPLSEVALRELYQSVSDMLLAYGEADYDTYRRFRTPVPTKFKFNTKMLESDREELSKHLQPTERLPEDEEELFKVVFSTWNNGMGATNFWRGVSFENSSIIVEESSTLPQTNLWLFALKQDNLGLYQPGTHFFLETTPEDTLRSGKKLVYATVTVVIKHTSPDRPYAKHIRFFWDDKWEKWLPWEYVDAVAEKREWYVIW